LFKIGEKLSVLVKSPANASMVPEPGKPAAGGPSAAVFAPVLDQSFTHVLALSARLFHNDALSLVLVKGVRRARSRATLDCRLVVLVCRFQLIRKAQPLSTQKCSAGRH
jgi:hypothetical protein